MRPQQYIVNALIIVHCDGLVAFAQHRLSDDGQQMQAAHQFLFEKFAAGQETKLTGDKPRCLRRIVLSENGQSVDGSLNLPLAGGAERALLIFRYIALTGEGFDGLGDISLLPNGPDVPLPVSTQMLTTYRVELPTLPAPNDYTPQAALRLRGTGTIKSVSLVPFGGGISEVFDSAPYRNLSEEFSPTEVRGTVDTEHELSIDGPVEIERSKWFRYSRHPNCGPRQLNEFAAERGFYPGRQIFKFEATLDKVTRRNNPCFTKIACGRAIPIQLSLPGIGQISLRNRESIFVASLSHNLARPTRCDSKSSPASPLPRSELRPFTERLRF